MATRKRKPSADDFTVQLGAARFDPAEVEDPDEAEADRDLGRDVVAAQPLDDVVAAGGGPDDTRLVQFRGPLTRDEIDRLRRTHGLALTVYVPNHTYVERVPRPVRDALRADPAVRAVSPYLPAYKRSALLDAEDLPTPEWVDDDRIQLDAFLFDRGDPELVSSAVTDLGATDIVVLDDRPLGGRARVRFEVDVGTDVDAVTELADVQWLEPVPSSTDDNVGPASSIQSGSASDAAIWDKGLRGEGQIIAVMDSGPLDIGHCFFADAAPNTPGAGHRKVVGIRNATGSAAGDHATFVAGIAAGDDRGGVGSHNHRGGAWAARLASLNRRDLNGSTLLTELTASAAFGAFIHTNSWHDNSHGPGNPAPYNANAFDVDFFTFVNENHLVLGSAGNTGEEQGAPGTAKNAICVSAARSGNAIMNLGDGNPGPTADNRNKPDLVTVGCDVDSAIVNTPCTTREWSPGICATSWATPNAAAAAALVRQYYTEGWYPTGTKQPVDAITPTGALIKATLIASTVDMTGVAGYPNVNEGWGLVRLDRVLYFDGGPRKLVAFDVRHAAGPTAGETRTHQVTVDDDTQSLKIVLVFTDAPGTINQVNTVVNDLDLIVTAPDGTEYVGNDFTNGTSTPDSDSPGDAFEPVEVVLIDQPDAGTWTIDVDAWKVATGNPGQGYALVVSANLKTGCFVASTVYGDGHHPDVTALRAWRNRNLHRRSMRAFARFYRSVGPFAAALVDRMPRLCRLLRTTVLPALVDRVSDRPTSRRTSGREEDR